MPDDYFTGGYGTDQTPSGWTAGTITGVSADWGATPHAATSYTAITTFSGQCSLLVFTVEGLTQASASSPVSPRSMSVSFPDSGTVDWAVLCYDNGSPATVTSAWGGTVTVAAGNGGSDGGTFDLGECVPDGWGLLNPVAYVQGGACVLRWVFIPSESFTDRYDTWQDDMASTYPIAPVAWGANSAGAAWTSFNDGLDEGADPDGCDYGPDIPLIPGHDDIHVTFLDNCDHGTSGAFYAMSNWTHLLSSVVIYAGGFLLAVRLFTAASGSGSDE
jgi:hypothetical protein